MFNRKITIIGAGSVGAATAYTLALRGLASEIVLLDIKKEKAVGEALDMINRFSVPTDVPDFSEEEVA